MATFVIFLLSFALAITRGYPYFYPPKYPHKSALEANNPVHQNFYGSVHNHFPPPPGSLRSRGGEKEDDRAWRFQIGDHFGAYEYIDKSDGYLKGFHIELLQAVCKQAGKRCHYILDAYTNCWKIAGGQELPGIGLQDGWYDGCIGLFPTPERLNSFNFTQSFTKQFNAIVMQNAGAGIANDLSGKKIGFVEGWAVSKNCLSRQTLFSGDYSAVYFGTHKELLAGFRGGEVDAVMTVNAFDAEKLSSEGATAVQEPFACTTGGSAIMTPYGSEVLDWWNAAFDAFRANGGYARLCRESSARHGAHGQLFCLE